MYERNYPIVNNLALFNVTRCKLPTWTLKPIVMNGIIITTLGGGMKLTRLESNLVTVCDFVQRRDETISKEMT